MKLADAHLDFIQTWGALGSAWGIPKSMAQIHALLLVNRSELSADDIMETIQLSRGNVNTNLRELSNWKLVTKQNIIGERKEFFSANHDINVVAKNIVQERKKRELEPVQAFLTKYSNAKLEGAAEDVEHFEKIVADLHDFVVQIDKLSDILLRMNDNLFIKKIIKSLT